MLGIYFGEIWIKIQQFSLKKMNLKMSAKGWPFCLSLSQWNGYTIQGRVHLKNYQICQKLVQCNDYLMSIVGQPWCWVCNHAFPAAYGLRVTSPQVPMSMCDGWKSCGIQVNCSLTWINHHSRVTGVSIWLFVQQLVQIVIKGNIKAQYYWSFLNAQIS